MNKPIGLKDLRQKVGYYARQINRGESFIVMRKNQPLFRLSPIEDEAWETVIDFTKIKRGGIEINDLLTRI
ncbi:MAG: hypothetical protein UX09_C0032G0005 [Candidatus Uhrbacteria bacterium GW2011_GWE2_45_35]|uniref:Antitoxin n=2 Tax=Candidatus Uhriibacteriota TaxID=1752732 RepID=A0A0G1JGE2_9BACT|nr:MAG: hypothetical protein UW63_C0026G0005 [Candidatus Uhrbacteria bacterium GW2011_GWF2_44_350]KKU07272.1 MAG: hypothetical protein UX09_C0032G0005 [Candidatus Uhrbacteria bacterium GW2011_GWE2_45_35]HBR80418.1 hypothetical protein [Candidatus Uhrbacteria bacterium]HCU31181.1 hypothetical protein [Candidatus Uhrbacteria bacterium]